MDKFCSERDKLFHFLSGIRHVSYAMAKGIVHDIRYTLTCVQVHPDMVCATDANRASIYYGDFKDIVEGDADKFTIPAKAVAMLNNGTCLNQVKRTDKNIYFTVNYDLTISIKGEDSLYPNIRACIYDSDDHITIVDREDAIKKLENLLSTLGKEADLIISTEKGTFSAGINDEKVAMECNWGIKADVGFKAWLFLDFLKHTIGNKVRIDMENNMSRAMFNNGDTIEALMPCRIKE